MLKRSTLGGLLAVIGLAISLSACGGSQDNAAAITSQSQAATAVAEDGTTAFVESVRDRVPTINSKTDSEIARTGENICADPSDLGMSAASADELQKNTLILNDSAKNMAEAEIIVGLAKQHMCRPV